MNYKTFSQSIENYLVNVPAILAIDTAARYLGGLDAVLPEKYLYVYVEKIIPELKHLTIKDEDGIYFFKQIKVSSFSKIDYTENFGIKCCTEEQIIKDILKRGYNYQKKTGLWGLIGYNLTRIIGGYCYNYTVEGARDRLKRILPKRYIDIFEKIVINNEDY